MLNTSTIFILTLILFCVSNAEATRPNHYYLDDGVCKSTVEIQGHICYEYTVTTKDGYILSLQRLPNSRAGKPANRPLVLLQHARLLNGVSWLLNPPDQSLAYILVDNGFDVWIVNNRGTKYSRGHVSLSPDDPDYWEWSWDELAAYDLPASVQLVYDQTGQEKMHYVGYSLGTLIVLAEFSQGKLLNMIRSAALLAPIAHLGLLPSPIVRTGSETFLAEPSPPMYELQNISSDIPLFLSHRGKDLLSDVKDVEILLDGLKHHNCDSLVVQYIEDYAHLDFILGDNANRLVYEPVIAFFMLHGDGKLYSIV